MKLRQLESLLGQLQQFDAPKIELEQYATGPHIASQMLYEAHSRFDDISGSVVADLGCGCGTLAIAAALLDAEHVVGVDVDQSALELASVNCDEMEVDVCLVNSRIPECPLRDHTADVVVMNPPFGTRTKGADMLFLAAGLKHVQKAALRDLGASEAAVLYQLRYSLPATYGFHKRREVDIEVDLWRFVPQGC